MTISTQCQATGFQKGTITVPHEICTLSVEAAEEKWLLYCSQPQPSHLTILVTDAGGEEWLWASSLHRRKSKGVVMTEINSVWVASHKEYWDGIEGIAFVYDSADEDLQCLAVRSAMGEGRLNKRDCLGRSLRYLDPEIAEPRIEAISQALGSGEAVDYEYSHDWDERHWEFLVKVTPLAGYDEVLVEVNDKHEWQREYWRQATD